MPFVSPPSLHPRRPRTDRSVENRVRALLAVSSSTGGEHPGHSRCTSAGSGAVPLSHRAGGTAQRCTPRRSTPNRGFSAAPGPGLGTCREGRRRRFRCRAASRGDGSRSLRHATCRSVLLADDHTGRILEGAKARRIRRSCSPPSSSWRSISRLPRRLASTFRPMLHARADEVTE